MKRYISEDCGLEEHLNGDLLKYEDVKAKIDARLKYFEQNYPPEYFVIVKRELKGILNE